MNFQPEPVKISEAFREQIDKFNSAATDFTAAGQKISDEFQNGLKKITSEYQKRANDLEKNWQNQIDAPVDEFQQKVDETESEWQKNSSRLPVEFFEKILAPRIAKLQNLPPPKLISARDLGEKLGVDFSAADSRKFSGLKKLQNLRKNLVRAGDFHRKKSRQLLAANFPEDISDSRFAVSDFKLASFGDSNQDFQGSQTSDSEKSAAGNRFQNGGISRISNEKLQNNISANNSDSPADSRLRGNDNGRGDENSNLNSEFISESKFQNREKIPNQVQDDKFSPRGNFTEMKATLANFASGGVSKKMKATFQNVARGKIENENVATDQNFATEPATLGKVASGEKNAPRGDSDLQKNLTKFPQFFISR